MHDRPSMSTMRLYGAAIAFASGGYSVAMGSQGTSAGATLMLVLGVVVVVHGAVLLTDLVGLLGDASGPLMVVYAVVMLANQAWRAVMPAGGMMGGGGMTRSAAGAMGTGWDAGMVTLGLLMLVSGTIMTLRREML